ncbi:hypothetical protein HID58_008631 [Brassica napus]|uniref:(rape) hypothetical protein n=1 Tax=Brassica napus TaxID=3708 RepID=A0A816V444_BRANA|nr:zinc finger protein CO3-like [Brassica napus]KAH0931514.1 hypothetical protein HID58_008631 [Brassica napus]CAF2119626.1 unnamed protein product [Brassica napus]
MCDKLSPVGNEKQSTRTSNRIKKRKHMESNSIYKSPSNLQTSPSNIETSRKHRKNNKKLKQSKTKGADATPSKEKKRAETVGGEKEEEHYDTVAAYLFNSANDSTISSILPYSSSAELDCDGGRNHSPYDRQDHGSSSSSSLLRTAMKKGARKEGETTEERWVSYSEVVDEVVSRSGTPRCCGGDGNEGRSSLALKLDYEQIMEAWLDKGTLYVDGEPPQTVPDLHASADVFTSGGEALWAVPKMETMERLWRGHREASLLRYKEKRQSRFFSKRIRYQVRKLNAEKRPRIKGRFVKRDDL